MKRSTNTDNASKANNWLEKNSESKSLTAAVTNTYYKSFFSDLTFTVMTAPDKVQTQYTSATTLTDITEDPITKGIVAAAYDQMQVSSAISHSSMDTITINITMSQVTMLGK